MVQWRAGKAKVPVGKVLNPTQNKVPGTDPYSIERWGQDDRTPKLVVDKQKVSSGEVRLRWM